MPWKVGDVVEELHLPEAERLALIKYAGASGDYNPIHTIDEEARRAGLPGVIQHGMLTMAQMGRLFTPYLDHGFIEHFQTRFAGMLFLGDRVVIGAQVTGIEKAGDGERVAFQVHARTSDGRAIAKGALRFVWMASDGARV